MQLNNKKVLVTGGAGFIGSHLVEHLLKLDCSVTVLDNLSTGRVENLAHIEQQDKLQFVNIDICDAEGICPYFKNVDYVFHLAALADIVPSIKYPLKYFNSNVHGTVNVLEAARAAGVKKILYAASSSCYGIPNSFPTSEKAQINPQYPYALTKYLAEECLFHWGSVYKIPVISLRLFNVYGLRSRTSGTYGAVLGVFLSQKLAGKPFTVVGDGTQTRDFVNVTDVARAFAIAAASDIANEIFNVGSGNPHSINQLIEHMSGAVTYVPKRPGEPDVTHADIAKIHSTLGWQPQVLFKDGVGEMLKNIKYWADAPVWTPETIKSATKDWFKYLDKEQ